MSKEFKGIPKASSMNYTGKGKLDEKSYVNIPSDLKTLDNDLYNPGDQVSVITTRQIFIFDPDFTSEETGHFKIFESGSGAKNYLSMERLDEFIYKATYDSIEEYKENNELALGFCTTFVRNKKMYRSFDYTYDNRASFYIKTKNFEGLAVLNGQNDGELELSKAGQLPYHLVDGKNNYGIMVSEHILFNDFNFNGTGSKSNDITLLPYIILNNIQSMAHISTNLVLNNFLANLKIPERLVNEEYLTHLLVTDGTTTYTITPKVNGSAYEFIDISSNPKLTNFKWTSDIIVNKANLQLRPVGVERWNSINSTIKLEDLRYTKAYENPIWLSEFIGMNGTDKYSSDAELLAIYNYIKPNYENRTRTDEDPTWQSVHSVVYTPDGIESLNVQENYKKNYINTTADIEVLVNKAEQYSIQAGNAAVEAETAKDQTVSRMIHCTSWEDYVQKCNAGIIIPGYSYATIVEPV